ncbi:MAG: PepSY domain-containing protein, partial [Bryobacteraceae bacterium]
LPSTPVAGATPITPEQAVEIAKKDLAGASPITVTVPNGPKGSYNITMHFPEDHTFRGTGLGRSWISIDQYSGKVLVSQNSRTASGPIRTRMINRAIHTGDIFGSLTRLVAMVSSLLVLVQVVSGVIMWLKRSKVKKMAASNAAA